tara:strand:- start:336 stop:1139 length:804 start_codon:yes stop_codon:yes gene_type:complete
MHIIKEKQVPPLRLIRATDHKNDQRKPLIGSDEYYTQVKGYAQQIRGMSDVSEIINMLDVVLSETKGLQLSDEVCAANEQVTLAEEKIGALKNELEQLRELVQTDQMTGALNRRGLNEVFTREAARADRNAQSLSVVMIDLDDFKQINDIYGHQSGDSALMHLVSIAKETLRPSDIIARYGGEEFVVLLPDAEIEAAVSVIHRLQNCLEKKCLVLAKDQSLPFTFSAGVASRSFGENQNSLISRADKALYQAKRTGKNRVVSVSALF